MLFEKPTSPIYMNNLFVLLVITDGRKQYINQAITSATLMLKGPIVHRFIYDDSGDEANHEWLRVNFPDFELIYKETRQGFGGAINSAWEYIQRYDFDWIFHSEDDFTYNREIPLEDMAGVLEKNPNVYQMALRRQAWNQEEIAAGGVIERWPHNFHQEDGWISHRMFYTTNPSLYRRSLIETHRFPDVKNSEGHFHHMIIKSDPEARYGYWGLKTDGPWVHHIGAQRSVGGTY